MTLQQHLGYWYTELTPVLPNIHNIVKRLKQIPEEKIAPDRVNIFRILRLIKPYEVNVLIITDRPYAHKKQLNNTFHTIANGIAFGTDIPDYYPQSTLNVYKEIVRAEKRIGNPSIYFTDASLLSLVKQGVMLINKHWTTELGINNTNTINSNWEKVTAEIIQTISNKGGCCIVFMGNNISNLLKYADDKRNLVIKTSHPGKLSYKKGMNPLYGSNFSIKVNEYLNEQDKPIIQWIQQ